jgi:hypothetical protein
VSSGRGLGRGIFRADGQGEDFEEAGDGRRIGWLAVGHREDLPERTGQRRGMDAGVTGGAQREAGQGGDAEPGRHQGLHSDEVVGGERHVRGEPGGFALPEQVAAAAFAAGDPAAVGEVGQVRFGRGGGLVRVRGARANKRRAGPGHQEDRVIQEQRGPGAVPGVPRRCGRGPGLGVPEDQCHIHVASTEHAQCLGRFGLGQRQVHARVLGLEPGGRGGHDRAERRGEGGEADPAPAQADVRRELIFRRVEPPDDLLSPLRQQAASVGQPDPASGPLGEPGTRLRFQARDVVADGGLGVVERTGRSGHRPVSGHRDEDAEPGHVQHAASIDRLDLFPPGLAAHLSELLGALRDGSASLVRVQDYPVSQVRGDLRMAVGRRDFHRPLERGSAGAPNLVHGVTRHATPRSQVSRVSQRCR